MGPPMRPASSAETIDEQYARLRTRSELTVRWNAPANFWVNARRLLRRSAPRVHDNLALAIANDRVAPVKLKHFFGPARHIKQAVKLLSLAFSTVP
jgi:hypothetical protein